MGIEYLLAWPCPLKEQFPIGELIRLIKVGDQAQYILRQLRADNDHRPADEVKIVRQRRTPTGVENEEITIQAMLDEASLLQPHRHHCRNCPANVFHRTVGCYGYITYPLQEETEKWLMARLPESLESTAGVLLQQVVQEANYNGEVINRLREHQMLFATPVPQVRIWSTPAGEYTFSSNQLLQMMFALGHIMPQQALLLLLFLGYLPHNLDPQLLQNPAIFLERSWLTDEHSNPQIESLIHFTDALRVAIKQGSPTLTDY